MRVIGWVLVLVLGAAAVLTLNPEWLARVKRAIRTLGWRFSAHRMVMDYVLKSYIPAAGGTSSDMSRS